MFTHLLNDPKTVKKNAEIQAIHSYLSAKYDASLMMLLHLPTSVTLYKIEIGSQKQQGTGICQSSCPFKPFKTKSLTT